MLQSFKNSDINFEKIDGKNPYFYVINALPSLRMKILDIACGREHKYQILSRELAKHHSVTGIDIECKSGGNNPKFIRASAEDFETKEKFDAVISTYFFGYVTHDWAAAAGRKTRDYEICIMKKIRGLLAAGGLSVHYMNEPWTLTVSDLESLGFVVLKFPNPVDLFRVEDGLCVLKKR